MRYKTCKCQAHNKLSCVWNGHPQWLIDKESACNAGDTGLVPGPLRSPGEGNGNPVQYFCLENPMDRGAWWATVHGAAKSQTRLSDLSIWSLDFCSSLSSSHISRWLKKFKESYLKFSGSAVKDVIKLDKLEFTWSFWFWPFRNNEARHCPPFFPCLCLLLPWSPCFMSWGCFTAQ